METPVWPLAPQIAVGLWLLFAAITRDKRAALASLVMALNQAAVIWYGLSTGDHLAWKANIVLDLAAGFLLVSLGEGAEIFIAAGYLIQVIAHISFGWLHSDLGSGASYAARLSEYGLQARYWWTLYDVALFQCAVLYGGTWGGSGRNGGGADRLHRRRRLRGVRAQQDDLRPPSVSDPALASEVIRADRGLRLLVKRAEDAIR